MLLLISLTNLLNKKEKFSNLNEKKEEDGIKNLYLYIRNYKPELTYDELHFEDFVLISLMYLLSFTISIYSAYLSFSCTWNGAIDNIFLRILMAIIAFILGPIYLIWYFIINYLFGGCTKG